MEDDLYKREKKWSNLYLRSEKLHRAKQLGMDYPRKSLTKVAKEKSLNILFVCSKNKWRSPTAERIFKNSSFIRARSRGTSKQAVNTISARDIKWADIIFVMEQKHKQRLTGDYPGEIKYKELHVLDIPDDYMDQELIDILNDSIPPIIEASNA